MAFIDTIYTGNGHSEKTVNLTGSVGHGGWNYHNDVLLIQTLFRYIAETPGMSEIDVLGFGDEYAIPDMDGKFSMETSNAIAQFQIVNKDRLLTGKGFVDFRIDPAKYRGRILRNLYGNRSAARLMTITLLHLLAKTCESGRGSYIDTLRSMSPIIFHQIDPNEGSRD